MNSMNKFVCKRLEYLNKCRTTIKKHRVKAEQQIEEYFAKIIEEFNTLKLQKIEELNLVFNEHNEYMKKNEEACRKFIDLSK
jgi:hypothetical protein